MQQWDVVVVGAGNAGLCAALAARESGASVLVLERAPERSRGGNSRFTAGGFRLPYRSAAELRRVMPDISDAELVERFASPYPPEAFLADLGQVTNYRADPDLAEHLVNESLATAEWMRGKGVRFLPMAGWQRLSIQAAGGGPGLVASLYEAAQAAGIDIWYDARALELRHEHRVVDGVTLRRAGEPIEVGARAVVLAAGGFQANAAWRAQYLGRGWDLARVRGTWCNTGDGIAMALAVGAEPYGQWSGAHAVAWDFNAPRFGDLRVGDGFQKHSYPLGVVVNAEGRRFVDEGADFLDYTYAKYGSQILAQPGQIAWQVYDAKLDEQVREEYRLRGVSRVTAPTLRELAEKMNAASSMDVDQFLRTIEEFNGSIDTSRPLDRSILDGRCADVDVPKSNWAEPIAHSPFTAYAVTCGITFTFGGLHIDTSSRVLGYDGESIPGLYAAGEMAAGVFFFNYPGGCGLTKGAVEGRTAGYAAARTARAALADAVGGGV